MSITILPTDVPCSTALWASSLNYSPTHSDMSRQKIIFTLVDIYEVY
ncbi:hypothetical protein [Nostoc sp.]